MLMMMMLMMILMRMIMICFPESRNGPLTSIKGTAHSEYADVTLYSTESSECCAHSMSRIAMMSGRAALDLSYLILLTMLLPLQAQM